jgi:hypothetical protein
MLRLLIIVRLLCHCDKIPDRNKLREEKFILLTVSEVSACHVREGMVEQLTS